jgi:hypothetical protein
MTIDPLQSEMYSKTQSWVSANTKEIHSSRQTGWILIRFLYSQENVWKTKYLLYSKFQHFDITAIIDLIVALT